MKCHTKVYRSARCGRDWPPRTLAEVSPVHLSSEQAAVGGSDEPARVPKATCPDRPWAAPELRASRPYHRPRASENQSAHSQARGPRYCDGRARIPSTTSGPPAVRPHRPASRSVTGSAGTSRLHGRHNLTVTQMRGAVTEATEPHGGHNATTVRAGSQGSHAAGPSAQTLGSRAARPPGQSATPQPWVL